VSFARMAAITYGRGLTYFCESCTGTDNFKKVIDGTQPLVQLDPQGWFTFGAVGLWVLVVSVLAIRARVLPTVLAMLGLVVAVFYGMALAGNVFGIDALFSIASSVGVLAALGWYGWIGMYLLRTREVSVAGGSPIRGA
jgi:prepilin signal peptidase PulO-like enzyme (type II secretory pathway)